MNKVAFITGSSRGIGAAVARGLAAEGWSLALIARGEDALASLKKELNEHHNTAINIFPIDVTDTQAVNQAVATTETNLGPIELLFNNAGINHPGTWELSEEHYKELLDINVLGAWRVAKAVIPHMIKRSQGQIINISSIAGIKGFAGVGGYASTKFALRGLNESLFLELVPKGIKVTSINPSWVDTDMASHASFPGSKMIQPEDIVETVKFLLKLSPNASFKELTIQCKENIL